MTCKEGVVEELKLLQQAAGGGVTVDVKTITCDDDGVNDDVSMGNGDHLGHLPRLLLLLLSSCDADTVGDLI